MATALLILLLVAPAVYAVEYTVGDTSGWTQGFDYTSWVSGKTFKVGDVLGHCPGGMKLAVTVVAASPPGTNTPSGSPPSTPATTGTPPSTTSSPPNGAACFFCSLYYNVMAVLFSFLVVAVMG
ncbi:Uclacyanin-3 [Citrus sinensis]|uniref:Uclacyanin-3 n=1 Tax=Citrus sinensis TaxID=2711 RepID=A0ACB8MS87_CITSI|nr:Uclacyanin-3 [Citrus sinensis]KAH9788684.1 Uclacyanin-3 [Citrus sinensis]